MQADAIDFLGDAANYALSLAALALDAIWRSRTALYKGVTVFIYGISVLGKTIWSTMLGAGSEAATMGLIGLLAHAANGGVALSLYAYRRGDADHAFCLALHS